MSGLRVFDAVSFTTSTARPETRVAGSGRRTSEDGIPAAGIGASSPHVQARVTADTSKDPFPDRAPSSSQQACDLGLGAAVAAVAAVASHVAPQTAGAQGGTGTMPLSTNTRVRNTPIAMRFGSPLTP